MFRFVVCIVVNTEHDRDVLTLRRGRDDHFFRTPGSNVFFSIFPLSEETRGFDNDIYTEFTPREVTGVPFGENAYLFPLTTNPLSVAVMSSDKMPWIESYSRRCASVSGFVKSLIATKSISNAGFCNAARKAFLPIRPKPLIPTLVDIGQINSLRKYCFVLMISYYLRFTIYTFLIIP